MKKTIYTGAFILIILFGGYLYATRPIVIPEDVDVGMKDDATENINTTEETYKIDSDRSTVEYSLGEVLNGKPFTVVGKTSSVSGNVSFDAKSVNEANVGEIKIDARTFKTDSDRRDSAVVRFILASEKEENNYITFTPRGVTGLPNEVKVDTEYSLKITGKLKISGIEKDAAFDTKVKMLMNGEISGVGTAVVKRSDYNLKIPNIPFVANVDENVNLKINFVLVK